MKCMSRVIAGFLLLLISGCVSHTGNHNPAAYHYQMGLSFLGDRNFTAALVELTEAEKLDPDNPDVLYSLGQAYVGKRRPDLAEPRLVKAITIKPNYSIARNDLGVAYLDLKRWDSAIQQFKIVKDDIFYANNENATINLGLAYLGKGDYPKALEELRSVATGNPRNPVIRLSIGRVWFAMDKTDKAVAEFNKAIEIYHDYGAAHYYLGLAYLKMEKHPAARSAFKEVIRLIPDTDMGRSSLEYLDLLK